MQRTDSVILLTIVAFTAALMTGVSAGQVLGQGSSPAEEFVGPFSSWRQIQCGGQDDTGMLQSALADVGTPGASPVLFIKSGTCRITSTLVLGPIDGMGKQNITILGADPATTRIVWAGPAAGTMLAVNGVGHSRYGRLTWDGGGTAGVVYRLSQTPDAGYFSTGNRHEDEVFTNLDPHGVAIRAGDSGVGDAETSWVRCHWIGPMEAGILLKNFNVGDYWVWDSEFRNLRYGITNYDQGIEAGAGWYAVNHSNFLNNSVNMGIGNTGFYSSRWNYSRGSDWHVYSYPIGSAPSPWTSQGETILDPKQPLVFGSIGALGVVDAAIRGGLPEGGVAIVEGYSDHPGGDLWAVGNTFTNVSPSQYAAGSGDGPGRLHGYVDDTLGAPLTDPGPLSLPPTPAPSAAPVIEVQDGDIAAALNRAGSARAIVHIPYGTYEVARTLEVGPNVILTGDGLGATHLMSAGADPLLHLSGPSHAILRDFSMSAFQGGTRVGSGIVIDNADQFGGLVRAEEWMSGRCNVGWEVSALARTVVDLIDHQGSSNRHADNNGANPSIDFKVTNARVHVFNGAGSGSDLIYDLHGGELVAQTMYYESGYPTSLVGAGNTGTLVLDVGSFNSVQAAIDMSSFRGLFTLNGIGSTSAGTSPGPRIFGPNSLLLGYHYGWVGDDAPPIFTGQPYALWLPRHNNGGGADFVDEQEAGIADRKQFLRDHLAPLRAAIPLSLTDRPADVTYVRIYRVGGELLQTGVRVIG
jgi:hypothetical protein